jgi:hypothetical protein
MRQAEGGQRRPICSPPGLTGAQQLDNQKQTICAAAFLALTVINFIYAVTKEILQIHDSY